MFLLPFRLHQLLCVIGHPIVLQCPWLPNSVLLCSHLHCCWARRLGTPANIWTMPHCYIGLVLICSIHNLRVIAPKRRTGMTNYMGYSEANCQFKPQLCRVSTCHLIYWECRTKSHLLRQSTQNPISSMENSEPTINFEYPCFLLPSYIPTLPSIPQKHEILLWFYWSVRRHYNFSDGTGQWEI